MTTFRVGRKLGRTIYRDDEFIGIMDRAEDAAMVVQALNTLVRLEPSHFVRARELDPVIGDLPPSGPGSSK